MSFSPLGGYVVGPDKNKGAIDRYGRVFDNSAAQPDSALQNLFVVDAAAISGALGINPTLTIVTHTNYVMNNLR